MAQADYDEIALAYDALWTARLYDEEILNGLPPNLGFVLDLGCGVGSLTRKAARRAHQVLGIDISGRVIDLARQNTVEANVSFMQLAIEDVTKEVGHATCDGIIASRALHHCRDLRATLSQLGSLLKPGGTLVIHELVSTGNAVGGRTRRLLRSFSYGLYVLRAGIRRNRIRSAVCGLREERRLFSTALWREHLRNEPDFEWQVLAKAATSAGLEVECHQLNSRFVLIRIHRRELLNGG